MASYSDCHGCSLCLLSCPMWLQKRDVRFSPQGIAKALQYGAVAEDLAEASSSCIDCGACDLLCPEQIDLSAMISSLRVDNVSEHEQDYFEVSCDARLPMHLTVDDLFVIDAAPFHADYSRRLAHYDVLRKATGCQMNLDLNRIAIATGIGSGADVHGMFDVKKQIEWLIQGRSFNRIVVENPTDKEMLAQITGKPVIHLPELLRDQ